MQKAKVNQSPQVTESLLVHSKITAGGKDIFSRPPAWLLLISAVLMGWSCKSSSTRVQQEPFFSIDGQVFLQDMPMKPDPQDVDVFQAEVGVQVLFEADQAQSAEENYWVIDGLEVSRGSNRLEHVFRNEGMYQVQHCIGPYNCANRWVNVRKTSDVNPVVEAEPEPKPGPDIAARQQNPDRSTAIKDGKRTDATGAIGDSPSNSGNPEGTVKPPTPITPPDKNLGIDSDGDGFAGYFDPNDGDKKIFPSLDEVLKVDLGESLPLQVKNGSNLDGVRTEWLVDGKPLNSDRFRTDMVGCYDLKLRMIHENSQTTKELVSRIWVRLPESKLESDLNTILRVGLYKAPAVPPTSDKKAASEAENRVRAYFNMTCENVRENKSNQKKTLDELIVADLLGGNGQIRKIKVVRGSLEYKDKDCGKLCSFKYEFEY